VIDYAKSICVHSILDLEGPYRASGLLFSSSVNGNPKRVSDLCKAIEPKFSLRFKSPSE
jgi:hypothetical protein